MKKYLALTLAILLALSALTACGGKKDDADKTPDQTVTDTPETGAPDTDTPDTPDAGTPDADPDEPDADPDEPAAKPDEEPGADDDFGADAGADAVEPDDALSDIVDAIYEKADPGYALGTVGVDLADEYFLSYYTGLTDGSVLTAAVASEPMISSQAFSLVVARVADGQDAKAVAGDMLAGVNPAKWICVSADDMTAAVSGDIVLLVMVNEYDGDIASADFANAFVDLYGGELVEQ